MYNPQALICGYVVATLFAMISITPQGVGVVEAAVLVLFTSYGVSGASGMAIALVYRGLVFWMPFLIGAILIQRTKSFRRDKGEKSGRKGGKRASENPPIEGTTLDAKRLEKGDMRGVPAIPLSRPSGGDEPTDGSTPGGTGDPMAFAPVPPRDASRRAVDASPNSNQPD